MNDPGVFAVHRGFFGHTAFKKEPFTEREAWLWLLSAAAWGPMQKRIGRAVFDLQRGQLVSARSYMAEAWQWDQSKVRRFLDRIERLQMVARKPTIDATIITICNYDEYQFGGPEERPATDQLPTSSRPQEEELKKDSRVEGNDATLSKEAWQVVEKLQPILGIDPGFPPPEWIGAWGRIEMGLRTGWNAKTIIESVTAQAARKGSDPPKLFKYYEKGIARAHAEQAAPVPQAEIIPLQTVEARRHARIPNLVDTAREMHAGLRQLRAETGLRDRADGADVRLLPQGRGERPEDVHGGGGKDAG